MAATAADGDWIDVSGDGGLLKKVWCGVENGGVGRRVPTEDWPKQTHDAKVGKRKRI